MINENQIYRQINKRVISTDQALRFHQPLPDEPFPEEFYDLSEEFCRRNRLIRSSIPLTQSFISSSETNVYRKQKADEFRQKLEIVAKKEREKRERAKRRTRATKMRKIKEKEIWEQVERDCNNVSEEAKRRYQAFMDMTKKQKEKARKERERVLREEEEAAREEAQEKFKVDNFRMLTGIMRKIERGILPRDTRFATPEELNISRDSMKWKITEENMKALGLIK